MSVRRALAAAALAAALLPAPGAAESPRWGTFELRVAGFRPDVDAEFGGARTPHADTFGKDRGWFPKLLASWTILDRFAQVDVGLGTGWFRTTGHGYYLGGTVAPVSTSLTIIPATLAVTLRVDGVAERWPVPLSIYGRAALERYHWLIADGGGETTEKGATNGWSVAAGAALLLDVVDPILAREFDADSGVNHTWLYVEVEKGTVDDFGSSRSWILSDERLTLAGGLRLVF